MKKQEKSQSAQISKAVEILKSGGVVIFPTDTVYGIGCMADDQHAINRIYKIKATPKSQPFPILVSSVNQVEKFVSINSQAQKLMDKYWPGALTIILRGKDEEKYGFRMPDSDVVRSIVDKVGPIIGTSANFHGQKAVSASKDLDPKLVELADFLVEGESEGGVESTVIDATTEPSKIIRQGAVRLKENDS